MTILANFQDPALWWFRKGFTEAAQRVGEPAVVFSMWNPQNAPEAGIPYCPHCWVDEYSHPDPMCPYCFGTGFAGGIRKAWFANVIRTNPSQKNAVDQKMGRLAGEDAVLDLPWFMDVWEFDFAVFVNGWNVGEDGSYTPVEQEAWKIAAAPQSKFMKTGSVQYSKKIKIATKCDIKRVNMNAPILGVRWQSLPELDSSAFFCPTPAGDPALPIVMASAQV